MANRTIRERRKKTKYRKARHSSPKKVVASKTIVEPAQQKEGGSVGQGRRQ